MRDLMAAQPDNPGVGDTRFGKCRMRNLRFTSSESNSLYLFDLYKYRQTNQPIAVMKVAIWKINNQ